MLKNRFRSRKRPKFRKPISKKSVLAVLGFLLLVFLIAATAFILKSNPFQIKNIHFVTATYCAPADNIITMISPKSQNLFIPDFNNVERKIMERYPCLKSVSISKVFPNTLNVSITPRVKAVTLTLYKSNLDSQFASLEATSSSQAAVPIDLTPKTSLATQSGEFVADPDGYVFAESQTDPTIPNANLFDQKVDVGQRIEGDLVKKITTISQKMASLGLPVQSINVKETSIYIESEPIIILSQDKDIDRQFASLQLILQQAKIDSRELKSVDLRFDKVIVIYAGPPVKK